MTPKEYQLAKIRNDSLKLWVQTSQLEFEFFVNHRDDVSPTTSIPHPNRKCDCFNVSSPHQCECGTNVNPRVTVCHRNVTVDLQNDQNSLSLAQNDMFKCQELCSDVEGTWIALWHLFYNLYLPYFWFKYYFSIGCAKGIADKSESVQNKWLTGSEISCAPFMTIHSRTSLKLL